MPRGGSRDCEVPALKLTLRAERAPPRLRDPYVTSVTGCGDLGRNSVGLGHERPGDERRVVADHGQLLAGDVFDRGAEPARVLQADRRQDLDLRRDHVRRVVAAAETRLDHGDLDAAARQGVVGSRRQRLELGHLVVAGECPVHELGCVSGTGHGGREGGFGKRPLPHLDSLRERPQMRRGIRAGPQPVPLEDRRDHPDRRGLAVRPDDVDRREPPLRQAEDRHQLVHAVEPEPHPEQLETEQVVLGLAERHSDASSARKRSSFSRSRSTTSGGAFLTKPLFASLPSARAISVSSADRRASTRAA